METGVARSRTKLENDAMRELWTNTGVLMFALAFSFLALSAKRELFSLTRWTGLLIVLFCVTVGSLALFAPSFLGPLGLLFAAWTCLGHAALSAGRLYSGWPRIRGFIVLTFVLGSAGVLFAIASKIG